MKDLKYGDIRIGDTVLVRPYEYFIETYCDIERHPNGWRPDKTDYCGKEVYVKEIYRDCIQVSLSEDISWFDHVRFQYEDVLECKSQVVPSKKKFKIVKKIAQEI